MIQRLHLHEKSRNQWELLLKEQVIGSIQIEGEILKWKIDPQYQGQGFAIEAGLAIREYAFNTLKMKRLVVDAKDDYDACIAQKLGMVRAKGQIYDVHRLEIIPYDSNWQTLYKQQAELLSFLPVKMHHIGSTAIIGCTAKPIIDILGETPKIGAIDQFNQQIETLGYIPLGEFGIRKRRFFRKREDPAVNLHIFQEGDSEIRRHLHFCDYLRTHPEALLEYVELKNQLIESDASDRARYSNGKEDFVRAIEKKVLSSD